MKLTSISAVVLLTMKQALYPGLITEKESEILQNMNWRGISLEQTKELIRDTANVSFIQKQEKNHSLLHIIYKNPDPIPYFKTIHFTIEFENALVYMDMLSVSSAVTDRQPVFQELFQRIEEMGLMDLSTIHFTTELQLVLLSRTMRRMLLEDCKVIRDPYSGITYSVPRRFEQLLPIKAEATRTRPARGDEVSIRIPHTMKDTNERVFPLMNAEPDPVFLRLIQKAIEKQIFPMMQDEIFCVEKALRMSLEEVEEVVKNQLSFDFVFDRPNLKGIGLSSVIGALQKSSMKQKDGDERSEFYDPACLIKHLQKIKTTKKMDKMIHCFRSLRILCDYDRDREILSISPKADFIVSTIKGFFEIDLSQQADLFDSRCAFHPLGSTMKGSLRMDLSAIPSLVIDYNTFVDVVHEFVDAPIATTDIRSIQMTPEDELKVEFLQFISPRNQYWFRRLVSNIYFAINSCSTIAETIDEESPVMIGDIAIRSLPKKNAVWANQFRFRNMGGKIEVFKKESDDVYKEIDEAVGLSDAYQLFMIYQQIKEL